MVAQVFASLGMGWLLGILLGLSTSPVVGVVVGALAALLASLIGVSLPQKKGDAASPPLLTPKQQTQALVRAGVFGLTCVLGIFVGIYVRAHDVLSPPVPTLMQRFDELKALGFSAQEARERLVPAKAADSDVKEPPPTSSSSALFATHASWCEKIAVNRFASFAAALDYYRDLNQPDLLHLAQGVDKRLGDDKSKQQAMQALVETLCAQE